jgi:hypothetical protein
VNVVGFKKIATSFHETAEKPNEMAIKINVIGYKNTAFSYIFVQIRPPEAKMVSRGRPALRNAD